MKFGEKIKQRFVIRCAACGAATNNSLAGSFSSWLFHEQLCKCNSNSVELQLRVGQTNPSIRIDARPEPTFRNSEGGTPNLGDQYEILDLIAQGGMASVYKVRDKSSGRLLAVKVLSQTLAADANALKRFEQEVLATQRLNHPNIVKVQGLGYAFDGRPYVVIEYVEGTSLATLIKERGPFSVSESISIVNQVIDAVGYAHSQGIIHRDIKPGNLLLFSNGTSLVVKVVDFGIAKAISKSAAEVPQLTQTGDILGTPAYMSPEQCLGEKVDERSDIYALGCVMYEMLTGKNPFAAENPVQSMLKHIDSQPEPFEIEFSTLRIPVPFEKIILRCLRKDPDLRYQRLSALKKDIDRLYGVPAGVLLRFVSTCLDFCLYFIGLLVVTTVGHFIFYTATFKSWNCAFFAFVLGLTICLYYAGFEYWLKGTPCKHLLGIQVTDTQGARIHWAKSAMRIVALCALVTIIICGPGTLRSVILLARVGSFANVTVSGIITGCLIAAMIVYWAWMFLSKSRQSPFDMIFDRLVASKNFITPNVQAASKARLPTMRQWVLGLLSCLIIIFVPMIEDLLEKRAIAENLIKVQSVVYAIKYIPEGARIFQDALEEKRIPIFEVPGDALNASAKVVGKTAKYGISAGQIVSTHDLEEKPK